LVENEQTNVKSVQKMDVLINITNLQSHNFSKGRSLFIKVSFLILAFLFFLFKLKVNGNCCIKGLIVASSLPISIGLSLPWPFSSSLPTLIGLFLPRLASSLL